MINEYDGTNPNPNPTAPRDNEQSQYLRQKKPATATITEHHALHEMHHHQTEEMADISKILPVVSNGSWDLPPQARAKVQADTHPEMGRNAITRRMASCAGTSASSSASFYASLSVYADWGFA